MQIIPLTLDANQTFEIELNAMQMRIDLRSRQTDARRFVHGFRHVLRQLADTRINAFHFGSNFFQAGIGKAKDR